MKAEKALIKILNKLEELDKKLDVLGEKMGVEFAPSTNVVQSPAPNKKPRLTRGELSLVESGTPVVEPAVEAVTAAEGSGDDEDAEISYPVIGNK